MSTYSIHFKNADAHKIQVLLDFVKSLDFVQAVERVSDNSPAPSSGIGSPENEYLPKAEIWKRYPESWVLLTDVKMDKTSLLGGRVLLQNKDKRELAAQIPKTELPKTPKKAFFTGETVPPVRRIGLIQRISA